ncbi:MAG: 16S rRNA methyltransferase [Candidatus Lokiarchaeota archaeon]|nr:16S rRNA methyltransferase [Candidatus Lokiarchaeota archaeon]
MTLTIILAECGLELIPDSIREYPSVKKNISRDNYSSQLLDNALHHSVMKELKNNLKRGRPDILHLCLLNALGAPLNKSGNLNLFIHTINNKLFKVSPEVRIPKNYNRFKGLMAKLLIENKIEPDDISLISPIRKSLDELINQQTDSKKIIFTRKGKLVRIYTELFTSNLSENYVVVIGGFQKSTFSENILKISKNLISISDKSLHSWIVVGKVITYYEILSNII